MQHKRITGLKKWIVPLVLVVFALLAVLNLQAISDYLRLRGYTPTSEIAALADQTAMTDKARRLFYINHPKLADRSEFNGVCSNKGEKTIVLGCYHSKDRGIFLFKVTDPRLNGVEQVTAAHEMLHAAYDRLGSGEREALDKQLQDFYDNRVTDERIKSTVESYKISEPNDIKNEMHSIFATEIAELTPELEDYYRQHFSDRSKVIDYASNYQSEFTSRQNQIRQYDEELKSLKEEIDADTNDLRRREAEIASLQRQMDSYRAANDIERYNAAVPTFNARVDAYNSLIRATQANINRYNQLVVERNAVAVEIRGLTESISSQLTPINN